MDEELQEAAESAGLIYVSDSDPGIQRERPSSGFRYVNSAGERITDEKTLRRIAALAIPPAWTRVWICSNPAGHLQATGRDAKGRKQYRYHARWREARDASKYGAMIEFARALPKIRRRCAEDASKPGLPREKVLALIVQLLEKTLIRVGNDEYARNTESFGLTTIHDNHVQVQGASVRFKFRGKSGVRHEIDLRDRALARLIKQLQDLPGQELFQYVAEDGSVVDIGSADVNEYLREITGQTFTAKDFRTWAGTVLASLALQEFEAFESQTQARRNVVRAIEKVATRLGNTPAVCKKCYVHPAIIQSYLDGDMLATLLRRTETTLRDELSELTPEEAAVAGLLQQRLTREQETLKETLTGELKRQSH